MDIEKFNEIANRIRSAESEIEDIKQATNALDKRRHAAFEILKNAQADLAVFVDSAVKSAVPT